MIFGLGFKLGFYAFVGHHSIHYTTVMSVYKDTLQKSLLEEKLLDISTEYKWYEYTNACCDEFKEYGILAMGLVSGNHTGIGKSFIYFPIRYKIDTSTSEHRTNLDDGTDSR